MKYKIKKTIKKQVLVDNTIVKYKIMYLEAQNTGEAKSIKNI